MRPLLSRLRRKARAAHVRIRSTLVQAQQPGTAIAHHGVPTSEPLAPMAISADIITGFKAEDTKVFIPRIETAAQVAGWRLALFGGLLKVYDLCVRVAKKLLRIARRIVRI